MTTVYVVIQGEYSDQEIMGVFSDEGLAESIAKIYASTRNRTFIEKHEINKHADYPQNKLPYMVWINKEGQATHERIPADTLPDIPSLRPAGYHNLHQDDMYISVWAHNPKHAIKIANDHRIQAIANNTWDTTTVNRNRDFQ